MVEWRSGGAGAVTWINGTSGLSGLVSEANSLVGSSQGDYVGGYFSSGELNGVTALSNGNYVVSSPLWSNNTGAATWVDGSKGLSGPVSASNSLVGATEGDEVGSCYNCVFSGVTLLSNGNYVVASPAWGDSMGAVTWANGNTGITGIVSTSNSLVGSTAGDQVGTGNFVYSGVVALSNGNYVVTSAFWSSGSTTTDGAATWADGSVGLTGPVSSANSLIGISNGDLFYNSYVIALTNGNYVVASPSWNTLIGAVTWGNGSTGLVGVVSAANSLVGNAAPDMIGGSYFYSSTFTYVVALSNGNYAVASPQWNSQIGAVTWVDGTKGISGTVSAVNSLVGTTSGDQVGQLSVTALSNGNFVVPSPLWNNKIGAATWVDGTTGITGPITASNSLVGTMQGDQIGGCDACFTNSVIALSNGNYVVASPSWSSGAVARVGAVTWGSGVTGISGPVSAGNSLIGVSAADQIGSNGVIALVGGNYAVASPNWSSDTAASVGAVTWASGIGGRTGIVSAMNSLVGSADSDSVGIVSVALSDGNYAVLSPNWANGTAKQAGAVSLGLGNGSVVGPVVSANSVLGKSTNGGDQTVFAYDAARAQMIVGQPASNVVSLFTYGDVIFQNGFEVGSNSSRF